MGARVTWSLFPRLVLYLPVYVALVALHAPLLRYYRESIEALPQRDRQFILAGMAIITLAYVAVFALVLDYARWVADWVVCMMLVLHLVKSLKPTHPVPLIACDNWRNIGLGTVVSILPRVGGVTPF